MENITEEQASSSPFASSERKAASGGNEQLKFVDVPCCSDHCTNHMKHKKRSVTKIKMLKRFAIPYSDIVSATGEDEDNKIISLDITKRCSNEQHEHEHTSAASAMNAPGIRIQLHLHRPLKWHVTATTTPASKEIVVHGRACGTDQMKAGVRDSGSENTDAENEEEDLRITGEQEPDVRLSLTQGPDLCLSSTSQTILQSGSSFDGERDDAFETEVHHVTATAPVMPKGLKSPAPALPAPSYAAQIKAQRRSSSSRSRGAVKHRRKRSINKRHSYSSHYDPDFTSEDSGLSADSETTIKSDDDRLTHYHQRYRHFRSQSRQQERQRSHYRKTGHLHLFEPADPIFLSNVSSLDAIFLTTDTNSAFVDPDNNSDSNSEASEGAESKSETKTAGAALELQYSKLAALLYESLNQSTTTTNSTAYFTRNDSVASTSGRGRSKSSLSVGNSSYYKSCKSTSSINTPGERKCNKLVKKEVCDENWKSWSSSTDTAQRTADKDESSSSDNDNDQETEFLHRARAHRRSLDSAAAAAGQTLPPCHCEEHEHKSGLRKRLSSHGTRRPVTWLRNGEASLWSSENYKGLSTRTMGANESNLQNQQHKRYNGGDGRLKSRSHSSSALHCMKSSSNNGFVEESFNAHHNTPYTSSNGINGSVPVDLWDLPANSQSFSPSRFPNQYHHHHQAQQHVGVNGSGFGGNCHYYDPQQQMLDGRQNLQRHHNRLIQLPVVEALINRARKGYARKGGGKQPPPNKAAAMSAEDIAEANRAKLYAISCPDVAQHSNVNGNLRLHQLNQSAGGYKYFADRRTSSSKSVKEASGSSSRMNAGDDESDDGDNDRHHHHHQSCASSAFSTPYHQHHQPHCQQHKCRSSSSERKCSFCASSSSLAYQQQQQQKQGICHSEKSQRHRFEKQRSYESAKHSSYHFPTFPFITEDKVFDVHLQRDPRSGLGLSVTGGLDTEECFPGLIRIKKIFPMGPAFQSGRLRPMDIILKANGVPLTGLTNHEALEVLRTTPTQTVLTLFRPPNNIPGLYFQEESQPPAPRLSTSESSLHYQNVPYPPTAAGIADRVGDHQQPCSHSHYYYQTPKNQSQPPPMSQTDYVYKTSSSSNAAFNNPSVKSKSMSSLKTPPSKIYGEFEITMEKIAGSLGFTLKQEDFSILGHYVRALVKDPALSDGRIQPGDRILAVNGKDLSEMSHEDAITFLRRCPPKVTLRIFRDMARTPISPLSPSESHKALKPKPLRQEAIDMLSDLALKRRTSGSSDVKCSHSSSGGLMMNCRIGQSNKSLQNESSANGPATLPRRRPGAHVGVTPSPKVISAALDRFAGRAGTTKSNQSTDCTIVGDEEESGSGSNNSNKVRRESGLGSSNASYPSETRSSGSGESTPAGTIIQCRRNNANKLSSANPAASNHKRGVSANVHPTPLTSSSKNKTDLANLGDAKRKLFQLPDENLDVDHDHDSDTGSWYNNEEIDIEDDDDTIEDEHVEKKKQMKQYTLHLDRISSFEDDSLDLASMEDRRLGQSPKLGGDKFRHGQPSYQSAILHSSASKQNSGLNRKRNLSLSHENVEKFQQSLGQSSRVQLSESPSLAKDASPEPDIPSSSSSIATDTSPNQTQQFGVSPGVNKEKSGNLLKWKGVMLSHSKDDGDRLSDDNDEDDVHEANGENNLDAVSQRESNGSQHETPEGASTSNNTLGSTSSPSASSSKSSNSNMKPSAVNNGQGESSNGNNRRRLENGRLPERHSPDGREFHDSTDEINTMHMSQPKQLPSGEQIFTVQLSRRWCSRLGFSLKGTNGHTHISAIYSDSVAGRDGRLRVGDEVIMVNQSSVRDMATTEVIDLMRKTRGLISITLLRKPTTPEEDILNSSDHQLGLT